MNTLQQVAHTILYNQDDIKGIFDGVHALHDFYAGVNGISANQIHDQEDIYLPSGKAISPAKAAHCLLEFQRTAVFIRGIYKAVLQLKDTFPDQRINILYAGCGPYAALLTPLTSVFLPGEIAFHLMDINELSLQAVKTLYEHLELQAYVADYIYTDAATYQFDGATTFHLIISETMLHALMKEPQVAIMQNLIPQLDTKGIFIPQQITISAHMRNLTAEVLATDRTTCEKIDMGTIYTISRDHLHDHAAVSVAIPANTGSLNSLYLLTDIQVYQDEKLSLNDCSLTLPVKVMDVGSQKGKTITFTYQMGSTPGFKHELN